MEETRCNVKAWKKQVGEGICSIADIKEKLQLSGYRGYWYG